MPAQRDHRTVSQANKLRRQQADDALRYGSHEPATRPAGPKLLYLSTMLGVVGIVGTIATATIMQWMN